MFHKSTIPMLILSSIYGCSQTMTPHVQGSETTAYEKIAVCSNGTKVSLESGLQLDLFNMVKGSVSASGKASIEVKGDFLSRAKVTEEYAVELYNLYLKCIQGQSSDDEAMSIVEARYIKTNKDLKEYGLQDLSTDLGNYYKQYKMANKNGQRALANEAYDSFQETLKKSGNKILEIDIKKNNDKNEFLFTGLNLALKRPITLLDGKVSITALDKRNNRNVKSCYIRINYNLGDESQSVDLQLREGKPESYKLSDTKYLLHVIGNPSDKECTISSYKA